MLSLVQTKSDFVARPLQMLSIALGESTATTVTVLGGTLGKSRALQIHY